jgi:hypothetical protein
LASARLEVMMRQQQKDLMLGIGIAVLGAVIMWGLIPWAVKIPNSVKIASLSPDFWPRILAGALMMFGLIMIGQALYRSKNTGAESQQPCEARQSVTSPEPGRPSETTKMLRAGVAMAGMLIFYILLEPLGIVLSSIIFLPLFAMLYGERRWKRLGPVAVLLPVGLYYFFTLAAHKPMPTGYLF